MTAIRPLTPADRPRLSQVMTQSWGSTVMSTRGHLFDALESPGFIADDDGEWLGYLAYEPHGPSIEVAVLEALTPAKGIGSALLAAAVSAALAANAQRLWLITTNDNVDGLRFYQRRGFVLVAVHRDAVTHARDTVKPELPLLGYHDIPLRDEIELELPRANWREFVERYAWPS